MVDLSTPTRVIVQDVLGGGTVSLVVTSITVDEAWDSKSTASVATQTAPPAWYSNKHFPVNKIIIKADGKDLFTGYVTNWGQAKPPDEYRVEAVDVLWVAENEWIIPDSIEQMTQYRGDCCAFVTYLLQTLCHYATVSCELPAPFILGPLNADPFEYGLESVEQLINRLGTVLQNSLWADQHGAIYWKFRVKKPTACCSSGCSYQGCDGGGIEFFSRGFYATMDAVQAAAPSYYSEIWGQYWSYNATGMVLGEHRSYARGNVLDWEWIKDEEPYRNKAAVFGKPPVKATWPPGAAFAVDNYPYTDLAFVDNVAIISSSLLQDQMQAQLVAQRMVQQFSLRKALRFQAVGNADFHVGTVHFIDTNAYFGLGKVTTVSHTIDDSGYQMRGESECGVYVPPAMSWQYQEVVYEGRQGCTRRCTLTWEIPVTWDQSSQVFEPEAGTSDWTLTETWLDVSPTTYNLDTMYKDVPPTPTQVQSGVTEVMYWSAPHTTDVRDVVTGDIIENVFCWGRIAVCTTGYPGGIWKNDLATSWDSRLNVETIKANWEQQISLNNMLDALWNVRGNHVFYPDHKLEYGNTALQEDHAIERWADNDAIAKSWTPETIHFLMSHPYETTSQPSYEWAVQASGFSYHYRPTLYTPDDETGWQWWPAKHVIYFQGGDRKTTRALGVLKQDIGYVPGYNWTAKWTQQWAGAFLSGFSAYSRPSNRKMTDFETWTWARPLYWPFGAFCWRYGAYMKGQGAEWGGSGNRHGDGAWPDYPGRMNALVRRNAEGTADGTKGLAAMTIRGIIARRLGGKGTPTGWDADAYPTSHLAVEGGSIMRWQGITLWGGVPILWGWKAEQAAFENIPQIYEWMKAWDGPPAPFVTDFRNPWHYLAHQHGTDNCGRQHRFWDKKIPKCGSAKAFFTEVMERANTSFYEPAHEVWREGDFWVVMKDWGQPAMSYNHTRLYHHRSWAFYADSYRYTPNNINYLKGDNVVCADGVTRSWKGWRVDQIDFHPYANLCAGPVGNLGTTDRSSCFIVCWDKCEDPQVGAPLSWQTVEVDEPTNTVRYHLGSPCAVLEF